MAAQPSFQTIDEARPYLGKQRIVTLDGDLLESSGAMTGGSRPVRSSLHFGATAGESAELNTLRRRLDEIEQILARNERFSAQKSVLVKQFTQELTEARQQGREQQIRLEQSRKELERLSQGQLGLEAQQERYRQELAIAAGTTARINYPNPAARGAASAGTAAVKRVGNLWNASRMAADSVRD